MSGPRQRQPPLRPRRPCRPCRHRHARPKPIPRPQTRLDKPEPDSIRNIFFKNIFIFLLFNLFFNFWGGRDPLPLVHGFILVRGAALLCLVIIIIIFFFQNLLF